MEKSFNQFLKSMGKSFLVSLVFMVGGFLFYILSTVSLLWVPQNTDDKSWTLQVVWIYIFFTLFLTFYNLIWIWKCHTHSNPQKTDSTYGYFKKLWWILFVCLILVFVIFFIITFIFFPFDSSAILQILFYLIPLFFMYLSFYLATVFFSEDFKYEVPGGNIWH